MKKGGRNEGKVKMTKYEIRLRAREGSVVGTGVVRRVYARARVHDECLCVCMVSRMVSRRLE